MVHILCIGFKFDDCHVVQVRHKICMSGCSKQTPSVLNLLRYFTKTEVGSEGNGRCPFQGCHLSSPNVICLLQQTDSVLEALLITKVSCPTLLLTKVQATVNINNPGNSKWEISQSRGLRYTLSMYLIPDESPEPTVPGALRVLALPRITEDGS